MLRDMVTMAMLCLKIAFWGALFVVTYVYAGYPLLLFAGSKLFTRRVGKVDAEPSVTIIVAAYNEERHLKGTIENKLALDYPRQRLQIVVVSDGSTDRTDDIAKGFVNEGVVFVRQEPRNGKTAAINEATRHATGEILVFADANSIYDRSALRQLVSNFSDSDVGYVTGKLRYANPDGTMTGDGCSAYMRYENFIRLSETKLGSIVGVNGGIDAVRRSLCGPMHPDDLPDLVLPLRVVASGFRVIYDEEALLTETANSDAASEYRMRVRVALRALWTLKDMSTLLNIRRHGLYAVQLISHKVLRYLAFAFLAATFLTSAFLWQEGLVYRLAMIVQALMGGLAWMGLRSERAGRPNRFLFVPYYFFLVNIAALQAFVKFLRGERYRTWRPRIG